MFHVDSHVHMHAMLIRVVSGILIPMQAWAVCALQAMYIYISQLLLTSLHQILKVLLGPAPQGAANHAVHIEETATVSISVRFKGF